MGSYTKEQLDNMTPMEICEVALDLGIINIEDLAKEILDWD